MKLIHAIARIEGFGADPKNRPTRNNNPGNIKKGKFADSCGAIPGEDKHFAVFPDVETGYAALRALLKAPSYKGLTVRQTINKYAPPHENDTTNYVELVCKWVGCAPDTIIDELLLEELEELEKDKLL